MQEKIESMIGEKSSFEIAKALREEYKNYLSNLDNIFEKSGKEFLVKHTNTLDEFIKLIYKVALREFFKDYIPSKNYIPITLVALGSYGREQLSFQSDIDLMVVYKDIEGFNLKPIIEFILQMCWDLGFKIGHRVHIVNDLFKASQEDITIKTALLESRFIYGSRQLWFEIQRELNHIRLYKQREFIEAKLKEYRVRIKKYQLTMQPNIKEGKGGLRDVNTLFWIAKLLFNVNSIKDLVPYLISEEEYKELRISIEFLYKVRLALHLSRKRKTDTITLDVIPDIAKLVVKREKNSHTYFTKRLIQSMWNININCQILIKKITANINFNPKNIGKLRKYRIDKNLYLCENRLYSSLNKKGTPLENILKTILNLENIDIDYDISFIKYLKNAKIIKAKRLQFLTKKIFTKKAPYKLLFALYKAEILKNLIHPAKKIINLAQFDGYHQYPVDIHSLYTIKNLENIKDQFIKDLYNSLEERDKTLLRIVAFMHDFGKGRKEDHSIVGAKIFKAFGERVLNLTKRDIDIGVELIKNHTLMSRVAQQEDLYNEKVILYFVTKLSSPSLLKMLYILTYADMNAVSDSVYNSFNAKLLKKLYIDAIEYFDNRELIDETQQRIRKEKKLQKDERFLSLSKLNQKRILSISSNLFFLKYRIDEILDICNQAFTLKDVYFYKIEKEPLTITIIRKGDIGINLGYLLGKLSYLKVMNIDIFKLFNEMKYFKIEFLENIEEGDIPLLKEYVENSFDMSRKINLKVPEIYPQDITINCDHSKSYASMNTDIKDQKGLMAYIISTFDKFGIDIASTKVQTIKNRAKNLFLIEKNGNFCINEEKLASILVTKEGK